MNTLPPQSAVLLVQYGLLYFTFTKQAIQVFVHSPGLQYSLATTTGAAIHIERLSKGRGKL